MNFQHDASDYKTLNQLGFFPAEIEDETSFYQRVQRCLDDSKLLEKKHLSIKGLKYLIPLEKKLNENELTKQGHLILSLYNCLPSWVPSYFFNKGLPFLTGGMAVQYTESEGSNEWKTFFQLKEQFQIKSKWFIYSSDEIISHEMCHIARTPLLSTRYEESIAYQTSSSSFRRYLGGSFLTPKDNFIFLSSLIWMILISSFFSYIPFYFKPLEYLPFIFIILLGLIRNQNIQSELKNTERKLEQLFPNQGKEVLFRLSDKEILYFSKITVQEIKKFWKKQNSFKYSFLSNIYSMHG